jgi:hypothetical protein
MLARVGDIGLVFGVAGAALLSGVLMEAGLVAPLAVACAKSRACLSPEGAGAAEAIAGLGWNDVAPLTWAGGPLVTGLLGAWPRRWAAAFTADLGGGAAGSRRGRGPVHQSQTACPAHYPLLFLVGCALVVFIAEFSEPRRSRFSRQSAPEDHLLQDRRPSFVPLPRRRQLLPRDTSPPSSHTSSGPGMRNSIWPPGPGR